MGCLLKRFVGSLTKFRIMATKGQAFALCHLKHWIFAPPVGAQTPCPLSSQKNLSGNQGAALT